MENQYNQKIGESLNKLKTELNSKTSDIDRNLRKVSKGIVHIEKNIISTVNEKLGDEIDELKDRLTRIENAPHTKLAEEQKEECSIVIRNLEEKLEENISERANNLIRHGLRLNVSV